MMDVRSDPFREKAGRVCSPLHQKMGFEWDNNGFVCWKIGFDRGRIAAELGLIPGGFVEVIFISV